MKRKCPNCNKLIEADYIYCDGCGKTVDDTFEYVSVYENHNESVGKQSKKSNFIIKSIFIFIGIFVCYYYIFPTLSVFGYYILNNINPTLFPDPSIMTDKSYLLLNMIINEASNLLTIILLLIIIISTHKMKEVLGLHKHERKTDCLKDMIIQGAFTFIIMYGAMYLLGIVSLLLPAINNDNTNQTLITDFIKSYPVFGFFSVVIIAPIVEELIFRFFLCRPLEKVKKWLGIIVSGLVFGAIHLVASAQSGTLLEDLPSLVIYVAMGLILGYRYSKTDNLSSNMIAHAFYNTISFISILVL